jgi:hypothetical protein
MKRSFRNALRAPASTLALAFALLAGCGGGGDSAAPVQAIQNTAPAARLQLAGQLTSAAGTGDAATYTGADVKFDASASTDVEGDAMTFGWTLTTRPGTSSAAIKGSGAVVTVTPDVAGTYVVTVRITDSKGAFTDKQANLVVTANAAPVSSVAISASYSAVASTATVRTVTVGASLLFDSTGSLDADGDAVTTTWELTARPAGSAATLATSGKTARLNTDVAGTYKVRARGTDPSGAYSETIYPFEAVGTAPQVMVLTSVNNGPVNAGSNYIAGTLGYGISLSSAGANPDGLNLTYAWSLTVKPAASAAVLGTPTSAFSQITPDVLGDYHVNLVVTASTGVASSYTMVISVRNRAPVAAIASNATPVALPSGPTLRLPVGTTVTLRGSGSSDADGEALTYLWSLDGKPTGSATTLSAADQSTVQLTTDKTGSYVVSLRVTDASGAYAVQTITVASGNAAPVAVVNASRLSTIAGTAASLNAGYSFDDDGDTLTYAWALDARPAASSATLSGSAARLAFTPDVAGSYVASVTVSDGKVSSVAYVTVTALSNSVTTTRLPFTPLISRYSKGLDKYVAVSSGPNLLNIVDPFTGILRQVPLPGAVKEMTISPDGKLAVALHEGTISVVDLENTVLLRSSATNGSQTEAFIGNTGLVYLMGSTTYSSNGTMISVIDGKTGVDMTATLGTSNPSYYFYGSAAGVYSSINRKGFLASGGSQTEIYTFSIGTNNVASPLSTTGYRYDFSSPQPFFLNASEDLLFTGNGNFFRTDTLKYAGKLVLASPNIVSMSQSNTADEALVLTYTNGNYDSSTGQYARVYEANYHRFTSSLYYAAADVALPVIGSAQSYGVGIYHSANSNVVALVQTGNSTSTDTTVSYFLVTR